MDKLGEGETQQQTRTEELHETTENENDAAVVAVGGMARKQHQAQERQKLGQADEPEIEQAAGHLIDLPTDGDDDHLRGNRGEKTRAQKQREIAVAQDRETTRAVG
jgi:hypothetical protein